MTKRKVFWPWKLDPNIPHKHLLIHKDYQKLRYFWCTHLPGQIRLRLFFSWWPCLHNLFVKTIQPEKPATVNTIWNMMSFKVVQYVAKYFNQTNLCLLNSYKLWPKGSDLFILYLSLQTKYACNKSQKFFGPCKHIWIFKLFQIKTVSPSTVLHKIAFGAKIPFIFARKASRSPYICASVTIS